MNTFGLALLLASSSAVEYTFKLYISNADWADSSATVSASFCTKPEGCKDGEGLEPAVEIPGNPDFGLVLEAKVDIDTFPTGVVFTTSNTNAWSFWKMELDCWTLGEGATGVEGYDYPEEDNDCLAAAASGMTEFSGDYETCNWWLDSGEDSLALEQIYVDFVGKGVVEGAACSVPGAEPPPPQPSCDCTGVVVPADVMDAGDLAATYGSSCKAWDSVHCDSFWPSSITGDDSWCCSSWCYVDPGCKTAEASWTGIEDLAFSYATCEDDAKLMETCNWSGGDGYSCAPTGQFRTDEGAGSLAGVYGSSCAAWDSINCGEFWGADDQLCCESWAYVSAACPYGVEGWVEGVTDDIWWSSNNKVCPDDPDLMGACPWGGFGSMSACPDSPACPYPGCPGVCYENLFAEKMMRRLQKDAKRGLLFGKMPEPIDCKAKKCI